MGAILVGFTEFEQELLEASASLAKVTFEKNIGFKFNSTI